MKNGRAERASTCLRVTRKVEGFGTFEGMSLVSEFAGYLGFYRLAADVASATETKSYRGVNGDGHRSTELRFVPLFCVPMKGRSTSSATVNVLRDPANSRSAR
jgi:hypothetical protein